LFGFSYESARSRNVELAFNKWLWYSQTANTETITVQDSNNQSKTYTINWGSVPGRSPKDEFGITLRVVRSIVLTNGRSYQLTYNDKGYLVRSTLPSGAYIRYTY